MIFDLLWLDGHSLMELPYAQRRERLAELDAGRASAGRRRRTSSATARQCSRRAREQGLEGIVAKRLDCPYEPGPAQRALGEDQERRPRGGRHRRLAAGRGQARASASARCWSACTTTTARCATPAASAPASPRPSSTGCAELLGAAGARRARRSTPAPRAAARGRSSSSRELVAEVEFSEWTREGGCARPSYKGLRDDKPTSLASATRRRRPARSRRRRPRGPALQPRQGPLSEGRLHQARRRSSTTRDRAGAAAAPAGRPLTLKRYPNGVEGKFFYEKKAPSHRPDWVADGDVQSGSKTIDYVPREDRATLVWLGEPGRPRAAHVARAARTTSSRPTMLVFDLDPGRRRRSSSAAASRCCCRGCSSGLGLQTSPRPRARRACRCTCR